jgi:predicted naringenin-chalcone synthase
MLIGISTAVPPFVVDQKKAAEELKKRMAVNPVIARLIDMASAQSGIAKRHIVIPDAEENSKEKFYSVDGIYFSPDTKKRMTEYERWSKILVKEAVEKIIKKYNINNSDIHRLITISCTGFFAPGLDQYLIEEFKLNPDIRRTNIGFMGCAASLIGFNSVLEAMSSLNRENLNTLLVSVELCSIHLQTAPSRDNILSNMIFADGCAAAFFSKDMKQKGSFELIECESVLFGNSSEYMGWKIGNSGFEMILSSELPKIIYETAVPALLKILDKHQLKKEDIKYWALHPGGRAILDSLQKGLELSETEMLPSREVLKKYGNMSSASILFVMEEILANNKIAKDEYCAAVAFGPGLTMEAAILKGI